MVKKPIFVPAIRKLELSKIPTQKLQREMMGDDLDLGKLVVYLKSKILFDTTDRVIDVVIERTIDGASTVTLTLNDYDRAILRSKVLNNRLDIQIDGLWFRLVKVAKTGGEDNIDLTFEQREIALLRTYPKPGAKHQGVRWATRSKITRAMFILQLIRDVKEVQIPVIIPHLMETQQIKKNTDISNQFTQAAPKGGVQSGQKGIPYSVNDFIPEKAKDRGIIPPNAITVKHKLITKEQIDNANTILDVSYLMGEKVRRKVQVCAIMTAIQESRIINLINGSGKAGDTSVGLFQQTDGYGSYSDRHDPATASRMFYAPGKGNAIGYDRGQPGLSFNDLCQLVQKSGHPDAYGQWRNEAEKIVSAYGVPPGGEGPTIEGNAADANGMGVTWSPTEPFLFHRGTTSDNQTVYKREDNWTCIRRMADEVGWRAFFIAGVFYYLTDNDLFKTQPITNISEQTDGVIDIGFDYDIGKKGATVDVTAQVGRWLAPPGSVVVLYDMGPLDGRWLVNSFSRSLFSSNATITLMKPQPKILEDPTSDFKVPTWATQQDPSGGGKKAHPDTLVKPLPHKYFVRFAEHDFTLGLTGYPAIDWFSKGKDNPVCAPESGTIFKISGKDPKYGPYPDIHGAFGWSLYLRGKSGTEYFMTHMNHIYPKKGDKVFAGQLIGRVADFEHWGNADHVHMGLHGGTVTRDDIEHALWPPDPDVDKQ